MKTQAAVLVELDRPLEMADLEIPALKPGQALVELVYSGVCHTQILEARGRRGPDAYLPHCLGHEGSGKVLEVGPGVTKVKAGSRVILSWIKGSGADAPGTVYKWGDKNVNAGAVTTFARHTVASENRLTSPPEMSIGVHAGINLQAAAMLGCALPTGLGAVFNTARPLPGQSLVVFGAGGVGLSAIAGAAIAGCVPVIAVDLIPAKLEAAKAAGATHALMADENVAAAISKLCPGGADFAIEATGQPAVMATALSVVRNQGGVAVIIGNARHGQMMSIDPKQFNLGKQLRGTWGGDSVPDRDYPRYAKLLASGKINLAPMLSDGYTLETVNQALDDLEGGRAVRPMLRISDF